MFRKILVAIDGSKTSEHALAVALQEAQLWKAQLHVIYVIETGLFSSLPMDNTWEVMYSMLEGEGKKALEQAEKQGKEKGVQVVTSIKQGHAGNMIVGAAEETGAGLVVVGSHGKSEVDRLLLGSVSSFVVAHAKVSVLVVRL
jgi:nucleotide-binding universal stress UspA family protein